MLYLWRSSEKRAAVDRHLVVLAGRDVEYVVLVAQLLGKGFQLTGLQLSP